MRKSAKAVKTFLSVLLLLTLSVVFTFGNIQIDYEPIGKNNDEINNIKETIEGYFDNFYNALLNKDIDVNSMNYLIGDNQLLQYQMGKIDYIIQSQKLDDTQLLDYELIINYNDFEMFENRVIVNLVLNKTINYNFMDELFIDNENHIILLEKFKNEWKILKDESSSLFDKAFSIDTNFSKFTNELNKEYELLLDMMEIEISDYNNKVELRAVTDEWDEYSSSKRSDAVNYALLYTDATGGTSTVNYNNEQFKSYGSNDCQNYVSQCIWYGFGGRNSAIRDYPMNAAWWANLSGETTTWNWTSTSHFKDYIIDNYYYNKYGVQGISYSTPSNMSTGDYIYTPGHVLFITKIDGSTPRWDSIYVSAHTNNRKNHNLKALYNGVSSPPSGMLFMKIFGIKNVPIS